jgi:hypothetical protein
MPFCRVAQSTRINNEIRGSLSRKRITVSLQYDSTIGEIGLLRALEHTLGEKNESKRPMAIAVNFNQSPLSRNYSPHLLVF